MPVSIVTSLALPLTLNASLSPFFIILDISTDSMPVSPSIYVTKLAIFGSSKLENKGKTLSCSFLPNALIFLERNSFPSLLFSETLPILRLVLSIILLAIKVSISPKCFCTS